jgi:hypothetical protein
MLRMLRMLWSSDGRGASLVLSATTMMASKPGMVRYGCIMSVGGFGSRIIRARGAECRDGKPR